MASSLLEGTAYFVPLSPFAHPSILGPPAAPVDRIQPSLRLSSTLPDGVPDDCSLATQWPFSLAELEFMKMGTRTRNGKKSKAALAAESTSVITEIQGKDGSSARAVLNTRNLSPPPALPLSVASMRGSTGLLFFEVRNAFTVHSVVIAF